MDNWMNSGRDHDSPHYRVGRETAVRRYYFTTVKLKEFRVGKVRQINRG